MQMHAHEETPAGSLHRATPAAMKPLTEPRRPEKGVDDTTLVERCIDVIGRLDTLEPPAAVTVPRPGERTGLLATPLRVLATGHPLSAVTEPDVDADGNDVAGPPERGGNLAAVIIEATGGPGGDLRPHAAYDATIRAVACHRARLRDDTPASAFNWTDDAGRTRADETPRPHGPRSAATAALALLLTRWRKKGRSRPSGTR